MTTTRPLTRHFSTSTRVYAQAASKAKAFTKAKTSQNAAASAKRKNQSANAAASTKDQRHDLLQRVLYPEPPTAGVKEIPSISLPSSIPPFVHSTIVRAYQLHLRHGREQQATQLKRKWEKQREAMLSLEKDVGGKLFRVSLTKEKGGFLFPTSGMHVPTETPPSTAWDYNWKRK